MDWLSEYLFQHIAAFHFFSGLVWFNMGVVLVTRGQRTVRVPLSQLSQAIPLLAAFGVLHGAYEWIEMSQRIRSQVGEALPGLFEETVQSGILALSFLALMVFAWKLLLPQAISESHILRWRMGGALALWILSVLGVALVGAPDLETTPLRAEALTRYALGIPAALSGAGALLFQQRSLRRAAQVRLSQDLVWCSAFLIVYGLAGQTLGSGAPIELFRGILASGFAIFMVRALHTFEMESRLTLEEALERERQVTEEIARINEALHLKTRDLALLLDLSMQLATSVTLEHGLEGALRKIIQKLTFPEAGLISLTRKEDGSVYVAAATGFLAEGHDAEHSLLTWAVALGERSVRAGLVVCRHLDGVTFEFPSQDAEQRNECRGHPSPLVAISFPLAVHQEIIGSITLSWSTLDSNTPLSIDEYNLIIGIAQQIAFCIENVRLRQQAQERERMLSDMLSQVVSAQEAERKRVARELHDITGQSLTGIALGLRGIENTLKEDIALAVRQIRDLETFSANALNELRQLIADLRPPQLDDLGLAAAVQWYLHEFETRYGINTAFVFRSQCDERLPAEHEITLFRIVQEALTNVARHACASHVWVQLEVTPTRVRLSVQDDGHGFDVSQVLSRAQPAGRYGWGLLNIQERATLLGGRCHVISQPGQGCEILVHVPLPAHALEMSGKHD
ncbi:MAG: hypothetical protein DDG58_11065 [Ardenticatenia bacterium]|jgi:signal transduction histidine kinase|nr:MAG: hypothetical protein DDG58_11065 [Ardenticatenia bacterium]